MNIATKHLSNRYSFCAVSVILCVLQAKILISVLKDRASGAAEIYPHEHLGLVLGSVSGMCIAVILPFPFLMSRLSQAKRRVRVFAWATWSVLLAISIGLTTWGATLIQAQ